MEINPKTLLWLLIQPHLNYYSNNILNLIYLIKLVFMVHKNKRVSCFPMSNISYQIWPLFHILIWIMISFLFWLLWAILNPALPPIHLSIHPPIHPGPYFLHEKWLHAKLLYIFAPNMGKFNFETRLYQSCFFIS